MSRRIGFLCIGELKSHIGFGSKVGGLLFWLGVFVRVNFTILCDWYGPQTVDRTFCTLHYHFAFVPYFDADTPLLESYFATGIAQSHD